VAMRVVPRAVANPTTTKFIVVYKVVSDGQCLLPTTVKRIKGKIIIML